MKKLTALLLAAVLLCAVLLSGCGGKTETLTLNVYNWGEYISDGSEGSFDTVREFEKWYAEAYKQSIHVNYDTYASNEDMYNKLSTGAVSYDVVVPSDYMIARMISEDMLQPLNFDNIPNYRYISDQFRSLYYDPENLYSVPYTYGVIGIIYNANVVDEADAGGWDLMWNRAYAGNILQFNNSRDAFGTAQYKLGLDVNSSDPAVWDQALAELKAQAPLVKSYVMDEIYNMMESGEAAIGAYYAGDYFTMLDNQSENVDLRFYYPERTNYFFDAMCIPKSAQHKELAEIFINYMLSEEPAIANAEYICYASPNSLVYENADYADEMGEEAMEILYPELEDFTALYNEYAYRNLDQATLDYLNTLWEALKIS
ncbi:MAG: spermidine/putrescine ABC transporter substrate-binding protein [Oscillospiraceae bacterium]|nr:spermidine/putrescine ABC transporter substrate-binding protein [Oscillospiraceae bacterium]